MVVLRDRRRRYEVPHIVGEKGQHLVTTGHAVEFGESFVVPAVLAADAVGLLAGSGGKRGAVGDPHRQILGRDHRLLEQRLTITVGEFVDQPRVCLGGHGPVPFC